MSISFENSQHDRILDDLINQGYLNACEALKNLLNQDVDFLSLTSSVSVNDGVNDQNKINGSILSFTTDLIGDMQGKSFLVLSKHDATEIAINHLKHSLKSEDLMNSFLLEMDNILSAAVISKLSQYLKLKIYGDVPLLTTYRTWDDFYLQLKSESDGQSNYCNMIRFQINQLPAVSPLFIWLLDQRAKAYCSTDFLFNKTPLL